MRKTSLITLLTIAALWFGSKLAAQPQKQTRAVAGKGSFSSPLYVPLDGDDGRMGSFEFGEGLKAGAESEKFEDSAFKAVTVPGDTQIQAGFAGKERWFETKDLRSAAR